MKSKIWPFDYVFDRFRGIGSVFTTHQLVKPLCFFIWAKIRSYQEIWMIIAKYSHSHCLMSSSINRQGDPDIFKVMNIVVCKNILIFYVRSLTDNIGWVLQRKQQVHVYIISAFPIVFLKSVLGGMNLEVHGGIERSTSC